MRNLIAVLGAVLALSACGTAQQTDGANNEASPIPLPSIPSEATTEAPATPEGPPRSPRGAIVKALGEEGGFGDETQGGKEVITFAVDAISPAQCTSDWQEYGSPAENGHLIAVSLRMATAPELAQSEMASYFTVSAYDFNFVSPDGVTHTDLGTMATYGCLQESESFTQNPLAPGSAYVGKIVLDLPAPNGILVYRPSVLGGGGWEWSF